MKQKIATLETAQKESEKGQEVLPTPPIETSSIELPDNPRNESGKYKLLVIEDHKDIQLYMKILFSKEYELHIAANGEEGLEKAQEIIPDLIITDIMMPIMNGFECTRLLKENHITCHIPIIQLTALNDETNAVKGIELGADDYITKPFNPEVLKTKVKRLIKNRQDLKEFYTQLFHPITNNDSENEIHFEEKLKQLEEDNPFVSKLLEVINNNISNKEMNGRFIADALNVSLPTLYRRTGQSTGYTIAEIIRSIRMKKASEMLKQQKYSMNEIGEAVGYSNLQAFKKVFTEFYGIKPSDFNQDAEAQDENNPLH